MHYSNFKNRLALISLAMLASSSLLAMDEAPMEIDDSPAANTRSAKKRPAPRPLDIPTDEPAFLANIIVLSATIMPPETANLHKPETKTPHKRRKTDQPLANKENTSPLTKDMGGDLQEEENLLTKAQKKIKILETTVEQYKVNSEGLRGAYHDKIQELEKKRQQIRLKSQA